MKKTIKLTLLTLIVSFAAIINVNAAYIHGNHTSWSNGNIKKLEDGVEGNTYLYKLWIDSGTPAFCVDYGAEIVAKEASETSLTEYFSKGLSKENAQILANKINQYLYFGYGSSNRDSEKYYLATQKLVWEAISQSGFYNSSYYTSHVKAYNFSKLEFKFEGSNNIDVSNEVSQINSDIQNHSITPSQCTSATTLEIAVGETVTYTDSNGVLSKYKVSCGDGITCETQGNDLKVTAVKSDGDNTITFTKTGNGTTAKIYKDGSTQGVVVGGSVPKVSCTFGIDTYQNVQTSDTKILLIVFIGLSCCIIAYVAYYAKNTLHYTK